MSLLWARSGGKPDNAIPKDPITEKDLQDIGNIKGATGLYLKFLSYALKIPGFILLATVLLLVGVQVTYGKLGKGVEFFPDIEPSAASILIHARGNLSVYEQDKLVAAVEERVLDREGIKVFYTESGKKQPGGGDDLC